MRAARTPSPDAPDEQALLGRARNGDGDAAAALFDIHRDVLERKVRRMLAPAVRRRISVSDVMQEARIFACERTASFEDRGPGAYRAWLLAIVACKAREALRHHVGTAKRALGREVPRDSRSPSQSASATGRSPSEEVAAAEQSRAVRRVLETLSADDQQVLRLVRMDGLSVREAAEQMGRSLEAVKKLYGRALIRFGHAFRGAGAGPR